ncbi:MAG TPA: class I SAM-dependent methyltransferase [Gaiellaceae bacterium]|nr:class I SAM-dependent methyltransferase [Gaiellaceae bacterium]
MTTGDDLAAEVEQIRDEYRRRSVAPQIAGEYSFLNPAHAHLVLQREQAILGALGRRLEVPLAEAEVLDVGCGVGTSLAFLAAYGAAPARLHGVDTDDARVEMGRASFALDLRASDGMTLPYEDASFDLVQQITMLSSVHSDALREQIAAEMRRVVRPGGLLLSFDVVATGLAPRLLNRGLSLGRRGNPTARTASTSSAAVELRLVRPLDGRELRRLFAPARELEAVRLSPYRPLVEKLGPRRFPRAFATALLWVARA